MKAIVNPGEGRAAFVRRVTRPWPPPLVPEIRLHLADESVELWSRSEESLAQAGLPSPFWAFAWAGGQALARYVLDHRPDFAGRSVLDVAAGSGIAGIGAALAGARRVEATEIDDFAVTAIELNAALNAVGLTANNRDVVGDTGDWDVVLAADVFYEAELAHRMEAWLSALHEQGVLVLIGDPGRHYLPANRLDCLAEYTVPVSRALEDREIRKARVWGFRG